MAYEGSVTLISGITQKNGVDFPLVDAAAVRVDDETRLDDKLDDIEYKADQAQARLDTITQANDPDTELADLRVGVDNTTYNTAGIAVRSQVAAVSTETGRVANSIAPTFDVTQAYDAGTFVYYTDGNLYKLTSAHVANVTWANTQKTQVKVGETMNAYLDEAVGTAQMYAGNIRSIIAPTFSDSTTYSAGDYVLYSGLLYRFDVNHSAGAWNMSEVTQVTAGQELNKAVRYDSSQALTATQKTQARTNIEAASANIIASLVDNSGTVNLSAGDYAICDGALYRTRRGMHGNFNQVSADITTIGDDLSALRKAVRYNLLAYCDHTDTDHKGLNFSFDSSNGCYVTGTVSSPGAYVMLFNDELSPYPFLKIGETYNILYKSVSVRFRISVYVDGTWTTLYDSYSSGTVTIPPGVIGMRIQLICLSSAGTTIDEYVQPIVVASLTDDQKNFSRTNIGAAESNINARMVRVGGAYTAGSVWIDGSYDHISSYDNTPYGIVGKSLNISRDNVFSRTISDGGLPANSQYIKSVDLSNVDYVITEIDVIDMRSYKIGTVDDTSSSQTIVGIILDLLNYIRTQNSRCTFILFGALPRSTSAVYSGDVAFTSMCSNQYSIHDLNVLMHRVAAKHRFIFVDFEDCELCYHWPDYAGSSSGHANSEDTYRMLGEYLAVKIASSYGSDYSEDLESKNFSSTNFAVLDNSKNASYKNIDTSNLVSGDVIRSSGKNLFRLMPQWDTCTRNGVTCSIDQYAGSINIKADNVTASGFLVRSQDDTDCIVNGTRCLFYFVFPEDTLATLSGNRDKPIEYSDQVYLMVSDNTRSYRDFGGGITMVYKANTYYYVNIVVYGTTTVGTIPVHSSFTTTGDGITFYPQLELGGHKTEFERFSGEIVTYDGTNDDTNIFALARMSNVSAFNNNTVTVRMFSDTGTIQFDHTGVDFNGGIYYDKNRDSSINGSTAGYFSKFSFESDTRIFIDTGIQDDYLDSIVFCLHNGSRRYYLPGKYRYFDCQANTEYGVQYQITGNIPSGTIVRPTIKTGIAGIHTHFPETVLIVESSNNGQLSGEYYLSDADDSQDNIVQKIKTLSYISSKPRFVYQPCITFIDDDTSSYSLVERYHNAMQSAGAIGNYAVMTKRLTDDSSLKNLLLDYEKEGYTMLYHCYYQSGNNTAYFLPNESRDIGQVIENVVIGLRDMKQFGFNSDGRYWVTPYGVNDEAIQKVARTCGFECMLANATDDIIVNGGNCNRFNLPRNSMTINDNIASTIARLKNKIDTVKAVNGWMIITTHANTWDNTTTPEDSIAEVVSYANTVGVDILSFQEAYESRKAMFYVTEHLENLFGNLC